MIGIEPARDRIEAYLRLPTLDPDDLRPLLTAAGHPNGLEALGRSLPEGTRRLLGRRLGISLATGAAGSIEVALFVSARSLFPGATEMLQRLVPAIARLPDGLARLTLVTLSLAPGGDAVSFAVGVTIARARTPAPTGTKISSASTGSASITSLTKILLPDMAGCPHVSASSTL
jgi:hypothetical protein